MRRGEIEIATVFEPRFAEAYTAFEDAIRKRHADTLFSDDGSTIDEQVARLLDGRTVAVAESCTGGLMAARLTDRAGSSAYVLGGVVAYPTRRQPRTPRGARSWIERRGAVSPEVAAALADGARERFAAEIGIGITGIAGPGGGPGGCRSGPSGLSVAGEARIDRTVLLPGDRETIRERSTTVTLHLLRRLLRA